jgi:hypothetical protein
MKIDQWSAEESENYFAKVGTLHPVALLLGTMPKLLNPCPYTVLFFINGILCWIDGVVVALLDGRL